VIRFCPFPPCSAAVVMAVERAAPGPEPDAVVRYPEHPIAGVAGDVQLCPASLMTFPLTTAMAEHLAAAAAELERQLNERAARIADEQQQPPRPPRRPRSGDSDWFRWNGGGGGAYTGPYDGYVAPPVMEQVLMPIDDEQEG
jgi:hypothetical protein